MGPLSSREQSNMALSQKAQVSFVKGKAVQVRSVNVGSCHDKAGSRNPVGSSVDVSGRYCTCPLVFVGGRLEEEWS